MSAGETQEPAGGWTRFLGGPLGLALPLLVALGLKLLLLARGVFPFNADEAVVGLMARHILQGERPVFFYGQAYLGSLDAWLIAGGFALAGAQVWVIRAVQTGLYLLTVTTTYLVAQRATGSRWAAWTAAMLLAVPTVLMTLYTTVSLGGYGEALLLGNLLLLTALAIRSRPDVRWLWFAWGLLSGLGLWVFGLTLVYSLATLPLMVAVLFQDANRVRRWAGILSTTVGALIGAAPWLVWALTHGVTALLSELGGSAIAGASPAGWLTAIGGHSLNLLLFGPSVLMGLRPPWSTQTLAWPFVPLTIAFWLGALASAGLRRFRLAEEGAGGWLISGVAAVLLAGFVLTPFGADPSGRYFLPVAVVMSVFGGAWVARLREGKGPVLAVAALTAVLLFNLASTIQAAETLPPGLTTAFDPVAQIDTSSLPALAEFLESHGETRGYTNYWVAYPLAFVSDEQLVFVPTLPYHPDFRYTPRDDRYPPYDQLVAKSPSVAYITTHHPSLDESLSSALQTRGVTFSERWIGPYHVFYDLSQPVKLTADDLAPKGPTP